MDSSTGDQLAALGIETSRLRVGNNRRRCPWCKKAGRDGALKVYVDHEHAVYFCHRCGESGCTRSANRVASRLRVVSDGRSEDALARADAEAQRQREVADEAKEIWNSLSEATNDHPYLVSKGLPAAGLRFMKEFRFSDAGRLWNSLVVPVRDPYGKIANLQGIGADGAKRFLCGGRVKGCYAPIEQPEAPLMNQSCFVCEGWASGRAFALMQSISGYAALSAANLAAVAEMARQRHPASMIRVAADRDAAGRDAARAAALAAHADVCTPRDVNDFSDLWIKQGETA